MASSSTTLYNAVDFVAESALDPVEFFVPNERLQFTPLDFTSNDLHCDLEGMIEFARMVDTASPLKRLAKQVNLGRIDTVKSVRFSKVIAGLPLDHVFLSSYLYLKVAARLMSLQLRGEEGHLLVDGNANISRVMTANGKVFKVHIFYSQGYQRWHCLAYAEENDVGYCYGKQRIISAAPTLV